MSALRATISQQAHELELAKKKSEDDESEMRGLRETVNQRDRELELVKKKSENDRKDMATLEDTVHKLALQLTEASSGSEKIIASLRDEVIVTSAPVSMRTSHPV